MVLQFKYNSGSMVLLSLNGTGLQTRTTVVLSRSKSPIGQTLHSVESDPE